MNRKKQARGNNQVLVGAVIMLSEAVYGTVLDCWRLRRLRFSVATPPEFI